MERIHQRWKRERGVKKKGQRRRKTEGVNYYDK